MRGADVPVCDLAYNPKVVAEAASRHRVRKGQTIKCVKTSSSVRRRIQMQQAPPLAQQNAPLDYDEWL